MAPESAVTARRASFVLAVLLVYVAGTSVYEAARRPFWYDEVFTVVLSRLPSMIDIQRALANAADTSAPGFYVIERAVSSLASEPEVGFRLASVAATCLLCACLFLFARTHIGVVGAITAAVAPLVTLLYHGYSVEARPYALAAGFLALAMLAWQRATCWRWRIVLALSLASAVSVNYHSVFALIPFALAEGVRTLTTRQVRFAVWAMLAAGAIPLAVFWQNLSNLRAYYGEFYWTTGGISEAIAGYNWFFAFRDLQSTGIVVASVIALVLVASIVRPRLFASLPDRVPTEAVALIVGFIALPWLVMAAGVVLGGGFTPRYGIGVIAGIALGLAYAAHLLGPRVGQVVCAVVLATLVSREVLFWTTDVASGPLTESDLERHDRLLERATDRTLPVVVSNGLDFVPLAFYEGEREDSRLVGLIDFDGARRFSGTDSVERDLAVLRGYMPARIVDYRAFAARHRRFYLYSSPGRADWWPTRFKREPRHRLSVVAREGSRILYLVTTVASS